MNIKIKIIIIVCLLCSFVMPAAVCWRKGCGECDPEDGSHILVACVIIKENNTHNYNRSFGSCDVTWVDHDPESTDGDGNLLCGWEPPEGND